MRQRVTLVCEKCKSRNYYTSKEKNNTPGKLELKKYCKKDREHTVHKEQK